MKNRAAIIGLVAAFALLYAVKFSTHPTRWIIGLIIAIPISAAIAAGFSRDME
jgi:hypothetical protein